VKCLVIFSDDIMAMRTIELEIEWRRSNEETLYTMCLELEFNGTLYFELIIAIY